MANLILIDNFSNKYGENLLSVNSLLNSNPTVNFTSLSSNVYNLISLNNITKLGKAMDFQIIQNISSGVSAQINFGNTLSHLVKKDSQYIFSFGLCYLNNITPSGYNVNIKLNIFKNGALTDVFPFNYVFDNFNPKEINTFTQSFYANDNDVLDFSFEFENPIIAASTPLFNFALGGFKLEVDDNFLGLPTPYSLPMNYSNSSTDSGWALYNDTNYTSIAPLTVTDGATAITLPNNALNITETQKPLDIATFYDGTKLVNREGDAVNIDISFKCKPTSASTNPKLKLFINVIGTAEKLYTNEFSLQNGNGVEHFYNKSINSYISAIWASNSAIIKIESDNSDIEIYDISYLITRTHKAR